MCHCYDRAIGISLKIWTYVAVCGDALSFWYTFLSLKMQLQRVCLLAISTYTLRNKPSSIEAFWKSPDDSEHIRNTPASASEIIPKESSKARSAFMKDEENLDFSLAWDYQSYSDFHFGSWRLLRGLFNVRCNDKKPPSHRSSLHDHGNGYSSEAQITLVRHCPSLTRDG